MRFTRFCKTHTRYQAKKPPVSPCVFCQKAYERERKPYAIMSKAAMAISKLWDCDVTLEANFERDHSDLSGIFISVQKIEPGAKRVSFRNPSGQLMTAKLPVERAAE